MEDKKAVAILINLLKKRSLNAEEKKAVSAAIGILSWTALSQSRIKFLKTKRAKSVNWQ